MRLAALTAARPPSPTAPSRREHREVSSRNTRQTPELRDRRTASLARMPAAAVAVPSRACAGAGASSAARLPSRVPTALAAVQAADGGASGTMSWAAVTAATPTTERAAWPGMLRVYLGAAPGVGKTYGCWTRATAGCERGTDVVVGLVETHGRAAHRASGSADLPVLPRRRVSYRGAEFDRDGPRRRCWPAGPRWCWSTNWRTPTCPAPATSKRWQDVEELLDAGIDVHHHGQHPAPGIAQRRGRAITGVPQRETVPGLRWCGRPSRSSWWT